MEGVGARAKKRPVQPQVAPPSIAEPPGPPSRGILGARESAGHLRKGKRGHTMETRRMTHRKSQPRGVVLIASLLIMVLLLLMGLAFVGLALTENKLAPNTKNLNAAFYVAEAGVESL